MADWKVKEKVDPAIIKYDKYVGTFILRVYYDDSIKSYYGKILVNNFEIFYCGAFADEKDVKNRLDTEIKNILTQAITEL